MPAIVAVTFVLIALFALAFAAFETGRFVRRTGGESLPLIVYRASLV